MDDLRDLKFEPPDFEGNLNPEVFLEWIQSIERIFEIKEYSDEKSFEIAILKLKKYASLWYETSRDRGLGKAKPGSRLGPNSSA